MFVVEKKSALQNGLTLFPNLIGPQKDFISTLRSRPDPFCGDAERVVQDA